MKIVVIYGSERRGSTYHIVQKILERLGSVELTEFFLPKDMPRFCAGCSGCFAKGEAFCPHREFVFPIQEAMRTAELLVFASPVYALRVSGQMKALLDHFAFQFMVHRPPEEMFSKTALIVTTAAGGGTGSTIKDIKASLEMWGVAKIFSYGKPVAAASWNEVSEKNRARIEKDVAALARKIAASVGRARPGIKTRLLFLVMRMMHKQMTNSEVDHAYWVGKGWLGNKRPW